MYQTNTPIRIPALAIAVVMGLASTFGLTMLLEKGSATDNLTVLAARGVPMEVAITPARIDVVGVRDLASASEDARVAADDANATSEVLIVPARVDVVAVRNTSTRGHLLSALFGKRAG